MESTRSGMTRLVWLGVVALIVLAIVGALAISPYLLLLLIVAAVVGAYAMRGGRGARY
jgi:hypothetical protein